MSGSRYARSRSAWLPALLLLGLAPAALAAPSPKIAPALARQIATGGREPVVAWVFFTDRAGGDRDGEVLEAVRRALPARALERRARRGRMSGVDAADLPVHAPYVRALEARGARVRGTSRWLDAASVEMPAGLATELARLPFVARIELVPRGRRIQPVGPIENVAAPPWRGTSEPNGGAAATMAPGDTSYYGGSFRQLAMMQVPQLHTRGLSGAGVLVCMLDSGFRTTHQMFAGLTVVARRDFIHGDTNVDDEPGDPLGAHNHGTWTLGCVAGSKPGSYSGGAFGAAVALGKTEDVGSETPVEMDYWQFGAEWADSLGADVISSSLGYSEFDNPADSYTYADMDGRTTVVTLAAVEAARRGITVVNSAGNEGATPWHFIIAPADADSMVAVGAVDSFNVVTSFSSRGPTSDGRIKPDVTAMGRSVLLARADSIAGFTRASGTSFSCPLTSGVVALLLQAHPTWGPFEVREALRSTALNHAAPNNDIGWGLVQGYAAATTTTSVGPGAGAAAALELAAGPNPLRAGAESLIRFAAPAGSRATIDVLDVQGRRRARLFDGVVNAPRSLSWNGRGERDARLAAGVYWVRLAARGAAGDASRVIRIVLTR